MFGEGKVGVLEAFGCQRHKLTGPALPSRRRSACCHMCANPSISEEEESGHDFARGQAKDATAHEFVSSLAVQVSCTQGNSLNLKPEALTLYLLLSASSSATQGEVKPNPETLQFKA